MADSTFLIRRLSGTGKGHESRHTAAEVSFGTGPGNAERFDPSWDRQVSPRHARVFRDSTGAVWAEDAGSATGTYFQGQRITVKRRIEAGAVLELGQGGPRVEIVLEHAHDNSMGEHGPARSRLLGIMLGIASVLMLGGAALWLLAGRLRGDSDEQLRRVAAEHEAAIGVVAVATTDGPRPFGTAWAVDEQTFATNAHVLDEVIAYAKRGGACYILINRRPDLRFRITAGIGHPRAGESALGIHGKPPAVPPYDVALLTIEGRAPKTLRLAGEAKLRSLSSGTRVAFLGFPMENLANGGVDAYEPVANMQSGIITSVSDFWLGQGRFETQHLLSHNLAATGGASGSPIFDVDGEVVGLLSAGNLQMAVTVRTHITFDKAQGTSKEVDTLVKQRMPSAALINFAQRVDLLRELLDSQQGRAPQ